MAGKSKERIVPPPKTIVSKAAKGLKKGDGPDARVMADAAVAKRQGAKRPAKRR